MSINSTKFQIQYCKQKQPALYSFLKTPDLGKETRNNIEYTPLDLSSIQNYNPIYSIFFEMNESNYHNVTLNQKYKCVGPGQICLQENSDEVKDQHIFIKYAPLLDPLRYLVGTYTDASYALRILPSIPPNLETSAKLMRTNNASYIDNFFCYLSSQLLNHHDILHGIDYYGSALAIQSKFKFNAADDLDYLMQSDNFKNNRVITYEIESHEDPFSNFGSRKNKNRLILENNEDIDKADIDVLDIEVLDIEEMPTESCNELEEVVFILTNNESSDTVLNVAESDSDSEIDMSDDEDNGDDGDDGEISENSHETSDKDTDKDSDEETDEDSDEDSGEEENFAYIFNFPVQVILLEKCKGTLDELFVKNQIQDEHMANAILMQIIMTLLAYQKAYHFTHNDLHTNNIMWNETELPFLYYKFENKIYKVPTYGKIFKIIDFGRSIYKFGGKTFCSDSFSPDGDASSQYNFEPYFNEKKARLEPNYAFDLCRLGTSLYDFLFDQVGEPNKKKMDSFQRTIYRWTTDDEGRNVLYKKMAKKGIPDLNCIK